MSEQTLKQEGFAHVYTWQDKPGTVYQKHFHKDKVTICITQGDVTVTFPDQTMTLRAGDRMDVPVGKEHSALVGTEGCTMIVGEMIEGDA